MKAPVKLVLVAACALIDADGRILLAQRPPGRSMAGLWEFPGGKVEAGESPTDAAVRETHEEVGLTVKAVGVLGQRTHPVTGREMVYVACEITDGAATLVDTDELDDLMWCPVAEVEERLSAGVFSPVLAYLLGAVNR